MSLLFARLPSNLRLQGLRRVQRFVSGTCLPSVFREMSCMCVAVQHAAPAEATQELTLPLLRQLQQDLSGMAEPSKVCLWAFCT